MVRITGAVIGQRTQRLQTLIPENSGARRIVMLLYCCMTGCTPVRVSMQSSQPSNNTEVAVCSGVQHVS